MMMLLFMLLGVAMLLVAYSSYRRVAIVLFFLALVLTLVWFLHHASSPLAIHL